MNGDLAWAPIGQPDNVLDIGTGTGIWAIQFAEQHPRSKVIGSDLSLIQPLYTAPKNCSFIREDAEDEWVFDGISFDYVHLRMMNSCFNDKPGMIKKIFDHLRPGGLVEFQDSAPEIIAAEPSYEAALRASGIPEFLRRFIQVGKTMGRDFDSVRHYKRWLQEAGFVDVVEKQVLIPNNQWPQDPRDRQLGKYVAMNNRELVDVAGLKLISREGLTEDEFKAFLDRVRDATDDISLHAYYIEYVVYGRKPSSSS